MCLDPDINELINSSKYQRENLKDTHIFPYNKNPNTITESITFLTVMTDINFRDRNGTFVTPCLTIYIYSHIDHMDLPKNFINEGEYFNRNDYLSFLIDEKINGSTKYGGIGKLQLSENMEFVATEKFLGRKLIFKTIDTNESLCYRG